MTADGHPATPEPPAPPPQPGHLALELPPEEGHQPADLAAWEAAAAAVLRKARRLPEDAPDHDVWDRLTRRTLDGVPVTPLGTPSLVADLPDPVRPPARGAGWDVRALLADPDARAANAAALTDLENGVTSLLVQAGPAGVPVEDLPAALAGVLLDVAPVVLDAPGAPLEAARALVDLLDGLEGGASPAPGTNLGVDPVAALVREVGGAPGADDVADVVARAADLARQAGCRALVVDGTALHDLGASDAQELGYVAAVGAAYLRALVAAGLDVADAAGLVELRVAATDEQFPTIAKLRAVRRLWARVLELSGAPADRRHAVVHAITSRPMMTRYDPWVNMLRTCVAAFAAGVGGADAVTVLPFDARLGLPDALARRVARNTSALLVEESHVAAVADPAGGSFAVERLTHDLAVAGWEELGRLEESGGVVAALADGSLRERVAAVAAERDRQVARRTRPVTGVSEFPNLHEDLPERSAYAAGALPVRAWAEPFEQLRDEPAASKVYLATMGTVAAHTARATFASNLFAAGGVDVVNAGRHDDVDAVLADHDGQEVVCLAGHDRDYEAWGAELVEALRAHGAHWVVLAGKPVEGVEVDDHCAVGVDALDFLRRTREKLA